MNRRKRYATLDCSTLDNIEDIEKLVALAAHPTTPDGEARNAAMQACRKMKALGFFDFLQGVIDSSEQNSQTLRSLEAKGVIRFAKAVP